MKPYNAIIKKNKEGKIEDVILLKEGFSFFAFLFSGLWFLYYRMWKELLALIIINVAFAIFGKFSSDFNKFLLEIAFLFMVALNATYWLCDHLKKKGYEFVGVVFGENCTNAKIRFVKNLEADFKPNTPEFDDSILNPELHRRMMKLKKSQSHLAA